MNSNYNGMNHCAHLVTSFVVEDFLTPDECKKALELASNHDEVAATLYDSSVSIRDRDSAVRWAGPDEQNSWLFEKLSNLVARCNDEYHFHLAGLSEGVQFATYTLGGHFDWHVDIGPDIMALRKLSITVQLTDDNKYKGGDFEISKHEMPYSRKLGTAIIFPSYLTHRVTPITQGTRQAMVAWVHGNSFQ